MTILFISGAFIYRIYGEELMEIAFVASTEFEAQAELADSIYSETDMWLAHPGRSANNPALWLPQGTADDLPALAGNRKPAVFFIHPTSYLSRDHWNAPLDDEESQARARIFLRGQASAFNAVGEVWAPRYRQAAIGAFLTDKPEGQMALDAAYADVLVAFDEFISAISVEQPIVLAGHSQGSLHLMHLLKDRVAGTPLANRVIAAYVVGWPVSIETDIPAMGLAACDSPDQTGCILSWESFAEPADYSRILEVYNMTIGFNGQPRKGTKMLCTNPINGDIDSAATGNRNLGTLVPNDELSEGKLVSGSVPARCDEKGILLIGDPPDLGPYTLPGNNYHVYDYSLFWANVRADVMRRTQAFLAG